LNLIALAPAVGFHALIDVCQQFSVRFLVLVLQGFPFRLDLSLEHLLQLGVGRTARRLALGSVSWRLWLVRQKKRRQRCRTHEYEAVSHDSSGAKRSESYQVRGGFLKMWIEQPADIFSQRFAPGAANDLLSAAVHHESNQAHIQHRSRWFFSCHA